MGMESLHTKMATTTVWLAVLVSLSLSALTAQGKCRDEEFTCQNDQCIHLSWYCDGDYDCTDESDELNCEENCFRCTSEICIPKYMQCDGQIQCKNGADEKDCKNDTRKDETNLLIVSRYAGFMYTTVYAEGKDYSSSLWRFASKEHVALDFDYQSKLLFWTSPKEKRIYRSTIPSDVRQSSEEEQTNVTVIVSDSISNLEGVAVDWINKRVYWTDSGRISVTDYNGMVKKTLINTADKPKAIKVDPESGIMYWTDCGRIPLIEKATMDGKQLETIVSGDLSSPNGLAIDKEEGRLYWVDGGMNKIESVDMNGGNRKLVAADIMDGFALITTKSFIFVTSKNNRQVYRINKLDGSKSDITPDYLGTPMDIRVYGKQEQAKTVCTADTCRYLCLPTINKEYSCHCENGNQTEGCLVRDEYSGEVPPSITTTSDITTTSENVVNGMNTPSPKAKGKVVYILLAARSQIELLTHHITDSRWESTVLYTNFDLISPIGIDYDYAAGLVFWTASAWQSEACICRAQLETDEGGKRPVRLFNEEVIVNSDIGTPGHLAVDWIHKQVFWVDEKLGTLSVANYDGINRRTVISSDLYKPRGIKVDPLNRMLYWTDWGDVPKIERALTDGSSRQTLVNTSIDWPNGIALDVEEDRVYWVDARPKTVDSVRLDGSDRRLIAENVPFPFSITVTKTAMYISSWRPTTNSIIQLDKHTGMEMDRGRDVMKQPMGLVVFEEQNKDVPSFTDQTLSPYPTECDV